MSDSVQMPALGESVTEGTVTRWLKQVGERVEVDEPLLEVSTDKVDTEIPSPVAGVVERILVAEDETVDVGTELAVIGSGDSGAGDGEGAGASADRAGDSDGGEPGGDRVQAEAAVPTPAVDAPPVRPSSTEVEEPAHRPEPKAVPSDEGSRVQMPALGESVTEGTVTRWLKAEGDSVEVDEPLLEVSTDKVDTEIPSPVAGIVRRILVAEDETVAVGTDLAVVGGPQDEPAPGGEDDGAGQDRAEQNGRQQDRAEQQPAARPQGGGAPEESVESGGALAEYTGPNPAPAPTPEQDSPAQAQARDAADRPPSASGEQAGDVSVYVTPLVRRLAGEHGVDLTQLTGTGIGGRIRKQDVLEAAAAAAKAREEEQARKARAEQPAAAATPPAPAPSATAQAKAPAGVSALRGTTEKMSRLRRVIAQRMVESLQVSAQLTTVVEVDVTKIARLRNRAKGDFEAREGVKLSYLPFFALAAVEALKQFPVVNASIEGDTIVYHAEENLGIAVDTQRGLLVPVIHGAGDLNIAGIARKITDLADRTRNNKITPDDLGGGTFTLTNTGSRGALFDTPIISQPQVAILGTGSVVKRPVVVTDVDGGETIAIRSMVYLALSYDHRLVDGADAARFLGTVKQRLEEGAFDADLGL